MAPRPRYKQALARATKEERKKERAALGKLKQLDVGAKTLERYSKAIELCFSWLDEEDKVLPNSVLMLDDQLGDHVCEQWDLGESRSHIGNLLSGLSYNVQCEEVKR